MQFVKWLSITARYTRMYLDRQLLPLGLNGSHHMYILKICEQPGITQDKFLECFYIHPSNITRSMYALEKSGFIRREINQDDRRTCRLYPTEKAWEVCGHIRQICASWQSSVLADFTPEDRAKFLDMLAQAGEKAVRLWDDPS